mgnify:CR=1 FL=1
MVCCEDCWAEADRTKVEFGTAEDLDPIGVDQIEVTDQAFGRAGDSLRSKSMYGAGASTHPLELQSLAIVLKQLCCAEVRHAVPTR